MSRNNRYARQKPSASGGSANLRRRSESNGPCFHPRPLRGPPPPLQAPKSSNLSPVSVEAAKEDLKNNVSGLVNSQCCRRQVPGHGARLLGRSAEGPDATTSTSRPVDISDARGFNLEVVGESHHQLTLRRIADIHRNRIIVFTSQIAHVERRRTLNASQIAPRGAHISKLARSDAATRQSQRHWECRGVRPRVERMPRWEAIQSAMRPGNDDNDSEVLDCSERRVGSHG